MLHSFLFAPFADPAAEAQFDALHAALQPLAEGAHGPALLLGNLALEDAGTLDAVLVRPAGAVLLLFVPRGGALHLPTLGHAPWQLAGQPLPGQAGTANPYAQFQRQQRALAAWLSAQPELGFIRPEAIAGVVLFAQPVSFGSEVEARLNVQSGADNFQLLSSLPHLPRRLQQLAPAGAALPAEALQRWLQYLQTESEDAAPTEPDAAAPDDYWTQKARQLWRWLGAEDVPADPPYGGPESAAAEQERLEQIRRQVRAELAEHTQAINAREAEREQTIAHLQARLAQASRASTATTELQARLAAETREKAVLEAAIRATRAEAEARNRELDARIQQLGTLIQQLQGRPALPAKPTPGVAPTPTQPKPAAPRVQRYSAWHLQPGRAAAVVAVLLALGAGAWGLTKLPWESRKPAAPRREVRRPAPQEAVPAPQVEPASETPQDEAAAQLEERLNTVIIDSTGQQLTPAPTDSVLPARKGYLDLDSTGVPVE
ncbi:hypothetical protein GCM10027048_42080 [Hymenobacter coalescens]